MSNKNRYTVQTKIAQPNNTVTTEGVHSPLFQPLLQFYWKHCRHWKHWKFEDTGNTSDTADTGNTADSMQEALNINYICNYSLRVKV